MLVLNVEFSFVEWTHFVLCPLPQLAHFVFSDKGWALLPVALILTSRSEDVFDGIGGPAVNAAKGQSLSPCQWQD